MSAASIVASFHQASSFAAGTPIAMSDPMCHFLPGVTIFCFNHRLDPCGFEGDLRLEKPFSKPSS